MNRVLLFISAALLFTACSKSVDSPQSAEEDLRTGTWKRTSGRVAYKDPITRGDSSTRYDLGTGSTTRPDLAAPTCWDDNSLLFKVANVGTINLGSTACTPSDPPSRNFTWQVTQDEKHISLYGVQDYFPIDNIDADIITRTLGFLTIRYKSVHVDTIYHTYDTLTYTDVLRRQ